MIGLIVTGHGNFATGILSSLRLIAGEPDHCQAVDFLPEESVEELTEKIGAAVDSFQDCGSVLILADLVGGSPYNVATKLRMSGRANLEVVGGTNLASLIEASMGREGTEDVKELAKSVAETAKEQVVHFLTEEEQAAQKAAQPAKKVEARRGNPDGPKGKIVHARVDERLIHGQVAMVWTNTVGASRIVVVNDAALKDPMVLSGLKMAKPAGVKLSIVTVKRAVQRFKENAYAGDRVFVITKNVTYMAELIRQGVEIERVNVGNVAKREGSKNIKKSVNLTEKDIADIHEMIDSGHPVTAQMIPNESDQSILEYMK